MRSKFVTDPPIFSDGHLSPAPRFLRIYFRQPAMEIRPPAFYRQDGRSQQRIFPANRCRAQILRVSRTARAPLPPRRPAALPSI